MRGFRGVVADFVSSEDGATAIEYGLIAAMIAVGCILAFTFFGNSLTGLFNNVNSKSGNAMNSAGV